MSHPQQNNNNYTLSSLLSEDEQQQQSTINSSPIKIKLFFKDEFSLLKNLNLNKKQESFKIKLLKETLKEFIQIEKEESTKLIEITFQEISTTTTNNPVNSLICFIFSCDDVKTWHQIISKQISNFTFIYPNPLLLQIVNPNHLNSNSSLLHETIKKEFPFLTILPFNLSSFSSNLSSNLSSSNSLQQIISFYFTQLNSLLTNSVRKINELNLLQQIPNFNFLEFFYYKLLLLFIIEQYGITNPTSYTTPSISSNSTILSCLKLLQNIKNEARLVYDFHFVDGFIIWSKFNKHEFQLFDNFDDFFVLEKIKGNCISCLDFELFLFYKEFMLECQLLSSSKDTSSVVKKVKEFTVDLSVILKQINLIKCDYLFSLLVYCCSCLKQFNVYDFDLLFCLKRQFDFIAEILIKKQELDLDLVKNNEIKSIVTNFYDYYEQFILFIISHCSVGCFSLQILVCDLFRCFYFANKFDYLISLFEVSCNVKDLTKEDSTSGNSKSFDKLVIILKSLKISKINSNLSKVYLNRVEEEICKYLIYSLEKVNDYYLCLRVLLFVCLCDLQESNQREDGNKAKNVSKNDNTSRNYYYSEFKRILNLLKQFKSLVTPIKVDLRDICKFNIQYSNNKINLFIEPNGFPFEDCSVCLKAYSETSTFSFKSSKFDDGFELCCFDSIVEDVSVRLGELEVSLDIDNERESNIQEAGKTNTLVLLSYNYIVDNVWVTLKNNLCFKVWRDFVYNWEVYNDHEIIEFSINVYYKHRSEKNFVEVKFECDGDVMGYEVVEGGGKYENGVLYLSDCFIKLKVKTKFDISSDVNCVLTLGENKITKKFTFEKYLQKSSNHVKNIHSQPVLVSVNDKLDILFNEQSYYTRKNIKFCPVEFVIFNELNNVVKDEFGSYFLCKYFLSVDSLKFVVYGVLEFKNKFKDEGEKVVDSSGSYIFECELFDVMKERFKNEESELLELFKNEGDSEVKSKVEGFDGLVLKWSNEMSKSINWFTVDFKLEEKIDVEAFVCLKECIVGETVKMRVKLKFIKDVKEVVLSICEGKWMFVGKTRQVVQVSNKEMELEFYVVPLQVGLLNISKIMISEVNGFELNVKYFYGSDGKNGSRVLVHPRTNTKSYFIPTSSYQAQEIGLSNQLNVMFSTNLFQTIQKEQSIENISVVEKSLPPSPIKETSSFIENENKEDERKKGRWSWFNNLSGGGIGNALKKARNSRSISGISGISGGFKKIVG